MNFRQFYQGMINDKNNGSKIVGKVIEKISYEDDVGIVIQFAQDNGVFIKEMKKIMEMNFSLELSEKLLKSFEEAKKYHKENSYIKNLQARFNSM